MKIFCTAIPDIKIIKPFVFTDSRGFFFESFNQNAFQQAIGFPAEFVQDNHSYSIKNVLRGLHYQLPPFSQGKLIRVIQGAVFDVVVDIRRSSHTFGQWISVILSAENKYQLWIPEGFAHGFVTLSDTAELLYKTTNYYTPAAERCIMWNDPDIAINWPPDLTPILSSKDKNGLPLNQAEYFS
ncbi:MAG: dTDP-4-dehydrorhamnose 3,5-epimerase [Oxalobacter formigenes]|nr:dTDP-4-dehydrorhamnose 3,5-epimerase [Oxalobacter formigenes]